MKKLKRKYVTIASIVFTILIGIAILIYLMVLNSRNHGIKLAELNRERVISYLDNKYVEEMVFVRESTSYFDSLICYYLFPKDNPNCVFRVELEIPPGTSIHDNYLTTYSEREMEEIVKETVERYFINATHYAQSYMSIDSKKVLENYYNINKKPLSWYDPEHLDRLPTLVIELYKDIEGPINEVTLSSFIDDIDKIAEELGINIDNIKFFIYENEQVKEKEKYIVYELKDGKYVKTTPAIK